MRGNHEPQVKCNFSLMKLKSSSTNDSFVLT